MPLSLSRVVSKNPRSFRRESYVFQFINSMESYCCITHSHLRLFRNCLPVDEFSATRTGLRQISLGIHAISELSNEKVEFWRFFAYFPSLALLVGSAMTAGYISKRLTDKVDNSQQEKTIQRARRIERICKTPQREPIAEGESLELEAFLSSLGIVRLGNGRVAFLKKSS